MPMAARVRARREAFCFWTIFYFGGCSEAAMGGGGAQRPIWGGNELKRTGARSARARTRGQNPLVIYKKASLHVFVPNLLLL
jgi:hypothetical protein